MPIFVQDVDVSKIPEPTLNQIQEIGLYGQDSVFEVVYGINETYPNSTMETWYFWNKAFRETTVIELIDFDVRTFKIALFKLYVCDESMYCYKNYLSILTAFLMKLEDGYDFFAIYSGFVGRGTEVENATLTGKMDSLSQVHLFIF